MSLTLVCLYIIIGLCCLLFINYKFLKIFITPNRKYSGNTVVGDATKNINNNNIDDESAQKQHRVVAHDRVKRVDVWSIPGPLSIPFFGTKWIYLWKYNLSKIHEVYRDFKRDYGPIVLEVTPNGIPIVNLFNRLDIEKVLRFPCKYPFRPPTEIIAFYRQTRPDRYASTGIANEQGEIWHNLRAKLTSQITSPRVLQAFLPALNVISDDFIDLLRAKCDPKTKVVRNFQDLANLFGLEAVCFLMLGRRMGFLSPQPHENVNRLAAAVKMLFITMRDSSYGIMMWKYVPTKTYRDFVKAEQIIYNTISEIVDEALREGKAGYVDDDENVSSVFWSILREEGLDIRDKKSAIVDFIAAGIETFANTLIFVLSYVTESGGHLQKIAKEFEDCSSTLEASDITRAIYTKACLQETYRICPTAFCLARILYEDTTLSGFDLKAGTLILCQNMIACHDPGSFKRPDDYLPDRWLQDDSKSSCRSGDAGGHIVVPFGIGKRQCPGRRFVEMELILILAKLARSFDISFCDKLEMEFEFLLAPKTPIDLILNERLP